ncbi:hypothetical protein BN1051_00222 [Arthrobacter saudimassiliensis]|uniref:Uncharacterized protein n=1 Tax=Arthrobacter saudimassiliensis TaxID=1461584 RepID=A0A078MHT4_9MICC|nr:hypothetical protein BN1051_00222 [Arthrobacter saudimassiliensis]
MVSSTADVYRITGFGAHEYTGRPFKESGSMFIGSGFMTFLLCLLLMIFIPPMRDFTVVIVVCTVMAFIGMVAHIVGNMQRDNRNLEKLTQRTNAFLAEATGDPRSRLTSGTLESMIVDKRCLLSLQINGVPGLEVKVAHESEGAASIVALLTPPEYGLESFDVLLAAEMSKAQ